MRWQSLRPQKAGSALLRSKWVAVAHSGIHSHDNGSCPAATTGGLGLICHGLCEADTARNPVGCKCETMKERCSFRNWLWRWIWTAYGPQMKRHIPCLSSAGVSRPYVKRMRVLHSTRSLHAASRAQLGWSYYSKP